MSQRRIPAAVVAMALSCVSAAMAQTAQPAAAPQGETAADKYKNIQVLKELPAEQLDSVMRFMTAALGTRCEFCHVQAEQGTWAWEKDDKKPKQTARKMIEMTKAINARDFEGRTTVNCASCHHGRTEPDRLPPLAQEMTPQQVLDATAARAQPAPQRATRPSETVDQVLDKYMQALGGRAALETITSRVMKGTVTQQNLTSYAITIEEKPQARYRFTAEDRTNTTRGFDGKSGWVQESGNTSDLAGLQLQRFTRLADLGVPLAFKQRYTNATVVRYGTIDGKDVIVLGARTSPDVSEALSFDRQSGLLLRRSITTRTALGGLPEQVDYSNYTDIDGIKVPFQIRHTGWNFVLTQKFTSVKLNTPIDDVRFQKPGGR